MMFSNIIPLGANCFLATDLKNMGLRSKSYPLDWVESFNFEKVIQLVGNNFDGFLDYDCLFQRTNQRLVYDNEKYEISFFHDFDKYISLKNQIQYVSEKYQRRIERFYKSISYPTLFIRYIMTDEDLEYISKNQREILAFLKTYNQNNEILYCSFIEDCNERIKNCYYVSKDEGNWYSKNPISGNKKLSEYLLNLDVYDTEKNLKFAKENAIQKTSIGFCPTIEQWARRFFKKPYKHNKMH